MRRHLGIYLLISLCASFLTSPAYAIRFTDSTTPTYLDQSGPVEARVRDLLHRMTLEEKIRIIQGDDTTIMANFGVPRLGIRPILMSDGPLGVRTERSTAFPAAILTASSFDPSLMHDMAVAMGQETLAEGRDMLLGPCIDIARAPQGGRNFESFGEDPFLTSRFAEAWVTGVQSQGVISSTKHFAANDQETERMTIDARVDERTLREIHLPAFEAAVKAGTFSVMAAYNRINGHYATENSHLMQDILKGDWNFKGFVISDWGAVHSTVETANSGLDMEMPYGEFWGHGKLQTAVENGQVKKSTIDDKVRRILRVMIESGTFDRKDSDRPAHSVVDSPEHRALALRAAQSGLVLLKNQNGILPITTGQTVKHVALIGPNAAVARNHGGGSSRVVANYEVSPMQGLQNRGGKSLDLSYAVGERAPNEFEVLNPKSVTPPGNDKGANGLLAEYFANADLQGAPAVTRIDPTIDFRWTPSSPAPSIPVDNFSVRWTGQYHATRTGTYDVSVNSDDGVRVYFDGKLVIDSWIDQAGQIHRTPVNVVAGHDYDLRVEYFQHAGGAEIHFGIALDPAEQRKTDLAEAVNLAAHSDMVVLFVGWNEFLEGETQDRLSMSLPGEQDNLVKAVAAANPNTVVVISGGGSTLMPWLNQVAGVVQAWYPGQEGGNAIADVLLGHVNFTGKLPISFYAKDSDASSFGNYPGGDGHVDYKEGLYVGYRHLDTHGIQPLFPFGFGLSYTQFTIDQMKMQVVRSSIHDPLVKVEARVTNTGSMAGVEVAQLYVHEKNARVDRPEQELKGFERVTLNPGESKIVHFELPRSAFAYYDVDRHDWKVDRRSFDIRIGNSSRHLPLVESVTLR